MIIGIGTDIAHIPRVQTLLEAREEQFLSRCFTSEEVLEIQKNPHPAKACARRFAAKEAYAKARGTGFREGFALCDVSVAHDALGKPMLRFSEAEQARNHNIRAHVSLSDDGEYATAFVVLERDV